MHSIYLKEEHEQFRASVAAFFKSEVNGEDWEARGALPRDIWEKMGQLGFLGINCPECYGGADADIFYTAVFLEELGRLGLGGFAAAVGVQQYMAGAHIAKFGSEALKQAYQVPSIQGKKVGALAISEPDVGSDVANLRTSAVKDGEEYLVNGAKTFITNGCDGDFATVAVRTGGAGPSGISLLVIDQGTPGFTHKRLKKMGWHSSDTGELSFDNVRVPAQNLVGEEGKGFYYIMSCFQLERLVAALTALGGIEATLEMTLAYVRQREAFGRPVARYQTIRHTLAELATELEATRQLTYHTCWLFQENRPLVRECSMIKLKSAELAKETADKCLQFFGGYGFMDEYPISRVYRDARVGTIVGGTSEIMKEILAKMIVDGVSYEQPTPPEQPDLPTVAELFTTLPDRFKGGWEKQIIHFDFSEDDMGCFTVYLEGSVCRVENGLNGEPDCTIHCAGTLYRDIELGRTSPEAAFMGGGLKISNLPLMMRFTQSFQRAVKEGPT